MNKNSPANGAHDSRNSGGQGTSKSNAKTRRREFEVDGWEPSLLGRLLDAAHRKPRKNS